jgi:DNA-binding cell septation regulator SpoVG
MVKPLNFKAIGRGSLIGFFDLRYHGLTIKGCRLMDGKNGKWIALPQVKSEENGETKYYDQMFLTPPEMDHVKRLVIADLEAQGHLAREPRKTTRRTDPMDEDLSDYKTGPEPGGLPF